MRLVGGTLTEGKDVVEAGRVRNAFFTHRLLRETRRREEAGECTPEQADRIYKLIDNPRGKDKDGNEIDGIAMLRTRVTEMVKADQSLPKGVRMSVDMVGFEWNWEGIIQFFKDHWLQILQAVAAILTILMFF
jgi:hypothetical protein